MEPTIFFHKKVLNEACSCFSIMISSDDQLISFQKGKETRSPLKYPQGISTDGSICECEEKYLLFFFFFSKILHLISENLLSAYGKQRREIPTGAWRQQVLALKHLPGF